MTTLVFAAVAKGKLGDAVAKVVTAARELGAPVHVLVSGPDGKAAAAEAATLEGVEKVLVADLFKVLPELDAELGMLGK